MPRSENLLDRRYLGDGVYVGHDGYHVWLTTEDGIRTTNEIALEPAVMLMLWKYFQSLSAAKASRGE